MPSAPVCRQRAPLPLAHGPCFDRDRPAWTLPRESKLHGSASRSQHHGARTAVMHHAPGHYHSLASRGSGISRGGSPGPSASWSQCICRRPGAQVSTPTFRAARRPCALARSLATVTRARHVAFAFAPAAICHSARTAAAPTGRRTRARSQSDPARWLPAMMSSSPTQNIKSMQCSPAGGAPRPGVFQPSRGAGACAGT